MLRRDRQRIKRLEREECSRRTKTALQYNLIHGKPHSHTDPIGWSRIKGNKLRPNETDRAWAKEVVRLYDERGYDFREIELVFRKRGAKTPRGFQWHLRRVRLAYSAVRWGFPRLYTPDLPPVMELKQYEASHGGRPPQLQHGAVAAGLLHTLPPMTDLMLAGEPLDDALNVLAQRLPLVFYLSPLHLRCGAVVDGEVLFLSYLDHVIHRGDPGLRVRRATA